MQENSSERVNRASTIAGVPPLASSMTSICGNDSVNSSNEAEQFASASQRQHLFNVRSTRFHSPSPSNCMSDGASHADLADDNNNFYVTRGDFVTSFYDGVSPAAQATAAMPSLLSRQMLSNWDMVNSKSGCSSLSSGASIRSTASCPAPKSTKDTPIDMQDSRMAIRDERPQANLDHGVLPDLSLKLDIDNDLLNAANNTLSSRLSTHHVPQASHAPSKYSWDSNVYLSPKHGKQGKQGKIKATNLFAHRLEIGSWKNNVNNEGDLVAKFYFAKRKLVWEVLEGKRKKKIEFPWCDIEAMRVDTKGNEDWDTWEVDLKCTPSFYSEMDPEPRKHTLWESCKDFTNGEAYDHLTHRIVMQKNQHFLRQFQKLLAQDPRLAAMMTPEGQQAAVCRIPTLPKAGRKRAGSFSAQTLTNVFHYDIEACALVSSRALLVHTDNLHQQSMKDACGRRGTSSSDDSVSFADTMSRYAHRFPMASGVSTPAAHFSCGAHQWQPRYHSHHGASSHGSPPSTSVSSGPSSTLMDAGQHQGYQFLQISNRSGAVSSQHSPTEPFYFSSNANAPPIMKLKSNANGPPSMNLPIDGSKIVKVAGRSIRMESEIPHQQEILVARGMEHFKTANHAGPDGTDPGFSFKREQLMGALGGAVNPNKRHCQNEPSFP